MGKHKVIPNIPERAYLRVEFIKEAKELEEQSKEVKNLLEILKTKRPAKQIMDGLNIELAKREKILVHTKNEAYSWFKSELEYFKSIRDQAQNCVDGLIDKMEGYLSGRIGEFNFSMPHLWEQLWVVYEGICLKLIESGNVNLLGNRVSTFVSEKITYEPNPAIKSPPPKGKGKFRSAASNNQKSIKKHKKEENLPLPHCMVSYTPKLCLKEVVKPTPIKDLFQSKKLKSEAYLSKNPADLLSFLLSISSRCHCEPLIPDLSKNNWGEYIGLKPLPTALQLDERMLEFNNQFKIFGIFSNPENSTTVVMRAAERFLEILKDRISYVNSLKGPQLKSYHSKLAHDWAFTQMYEFVANSIEKSIHQPQKKAIAWTKNLKCLPDDLQNRITENLLEGVCKEVAKITNWKCPGGRPSKRKPRQQ